MSYCVNCGVELDSSVKRCPLCRTLVINPNESTDIPSVPAYPTQEVVTVVRKIRYLSALLISTILLTALVLCSLCNFIVAGQLNWSLYVIFSVIYAWIFIVPPILISHNRFISSVCIDFIATLIYLPVINGLATPDLQWFFPLSLPIASYIFFSFVIIYILSRSKKRNIFYIISAGLILAGIFCLLAEYLILNFLNKPIEFFWSVPAVISCFGMALIFPIFSKLSKLSSFKKRMHL